MKSVKLTDDNIRFLRQAPSPIIDYFLNERKKQDQLKIHLRHFSFVLLMNYSRTQGKKTELPSNTLLLSSPCNGLVFIVELTSITDIGMVGESARIDIVANNIEDFKRITYLERRQH